MTLSPDGVAPVAAGNTYTMLCTVTVVPGLVVKPLIEWTRVDRMNDVLNASNGSSLQLIFDPLYTSNASMYTCKAKVVISNVSINSVGEASRNLTVGSESITFVVFDGNVYYSSLPSTRAKGGDLQKLLWHSVCRDRANSDCCYFSHFDYWSGCGYSSGSQLDQRK